MTDQAMNPIEQPKKGMSTGLKVTLIVVGAIVVLIAAAVIYCFANKEKLVVAGAKMMVTGMKTELQENPVEGVDTERFNRVADAFLVKIDEPDQEFDNIALFAQTAGEIVRNQPYTEQQVERLVQSMIQLYPELAELAAPTMVEELEATIPTDSAGTETTETESE